MVQILLSFSSGGFYPVKDFFLLKVFPKEIYIELNSYVTLLVSIAVNNPKTTYIVGDTFVEPTVTATYDNPPAAVDVYLRMDDSRLVTESKDITRTIKFYKVDGDKVSRIIMIIKSW